ncbi:MAG: hypothetical protein JW900_14610 [Anaerolineae bacterium]|nr:hypothetical protein [Anaerolineae bacterium]
MHQQYPPAQHIYYGSQYSGCLKFLLYVVSFAIPLVGLILGLVYMSRPDPESKRLGQTCLIISIVSFVLICCLTVISLLSGAVPLAILPFREGGY